MLTTLKTAVIWISRTLGHVLENSGHPCGWYWKGFFIIFISNGIQGDIIIRRGEYF